MRRKAPFLRPQYIALEYLAQFGQTDKNDEKPRFRVALKIQHDMQLIENCHRQEVRLIQ